MSNLDELFKEKLSDHTLEPTGEAWSKVESGLQARKSSYGWMRWAAALLLGSLLIGSYWLPNKVDPGTIAQSHDVTVTPRKTEKKEILQKTTEPRKIDKAIASQTQSEMKPVEPNVEKVEQVVTLKETIQLVPEEDTLISEVVRNPVSTSAIALTYTLETIEETTAETKTVATVAVVDQKESSLKRVVKFARNVKNGDTPLIGLRGMKDELFARELRKKTTTKKQ
jgi:hypothetical protein